MRDLSIIIPVRHQDHLWKKLVSDLLTHNDEFEVILVGPDFKNKESDSPRVRFVYSEEGRAKQLNHGAKVSKKSFIWFLHADSKLEKNSIQKVEVCLKKNENAIFFFDLNFLNDGPSLMKLNNVGTFLRSRLLKMPFGDQGLFMAKRTFFFLGQFDQEAAYGEDHLLIWKAHQNKISVLPAKMNLMTSSRKYKKNGWLKTTLTHLFLTYKQAYPEWIKCLKKSQNKTGVAIFVKTPGVSSVKSRLAAHIGKESAENFFKLSVAATQSLVMEASRKSKGDIVAFWAVAEEDQLSHPLWNSFQTISQGTGDLGDRLDKVYSTLKKDYSQVFLIGADLPHLKHEIILKAHQELQGNSPFILGETDDGGFYLFGGKEDITKEIWNSVPYSNEETSAKLKEALNVDRFSFLEKNFDIDYFEDLQKLSTINASSLLPEQIEIVNWAKTNSSS